MRPLLVGFALAAVLHFVFAAFGEFFFLETRRAFQLNFTAGALIGLVLGLLVPRLAGRDAREASRAMALVAVPGLLWMAAVASHVGVFFPALERGLDKVFGSWMLWLYGFALAGALLVEWRARRIRKT